MPIEWEPPSSFAAGMASARSLSVLSRATDYLQGLSDGPSRIFAGMMDESLPGTWTVCWAGRVRHQKNSFRWVVWVLGDNIHMQIKYNTSIIVSQSWTPGYDRDWTMASGTADISGLGLTVGTWYDVVVEYRELNGYREGLHIAMLREEEDISGWQAMDTFTASDSGLAAKLNKVKADVLALKDVADMPLAAMPTISYETSDSWTVVKWPDGIEWGGGCVQPLATAKLEYAFQGENGMQIKVFYTDDDGAWVDAAPPTGHRVATITLTSSDIEEGTIDVTNAQNAGNWCRLKMEVKATTGHPILYVWYLGIREEDTLTPAERWRHGRGLDYQDLNTVKTRLEDMHPEAGASPEGSYRLSKYRNQAIKNVTSAGHRIALLRRPGWYYLHYYTAGLTPNPSLNYLPPGGTEWQSSPLDTASGWHTLDLRTLRGMLLEGTWYNLDDVDNGQEWQDE